jgi:hypothetical protein
MQVKIGDTLYDPMEVPILLILSDQDKISISSMHPDSKKIIFYNDKLDAESVRILFNDK